MKDAQTDAEPPRDVAANAVALTGLLAFDAIVLLPALTIAALIMLILVLLSFAGLIGGVLVMVGGPFADPSAGATATVLAGLAFTAGSVCILSLLAIACLSVGRPVVRYVRLHLRLLKEAA